MTILERCYKTIDREGIHAENTSDVAGKALCINLIQLPYPEEKNTIVTVSAMKNGNKLNCLPALTFGRVIGDIEESLEVATNDYYPYGMSLKDGIKDAWYIRLNCHRVFVVRTSQMFKVLESFSHSDLVKDIKSEGIDGIRIVVNSYSHKMQIDL